MDRNIRLWYSNSEVQAGYRSFSQCHPLSNLLSYQAGEKQDKQVAPGTYKEHSG
jgi:hypothetical protein